MGCITRSGSDKGFPNSYAAILDLADDVTEKANDIFRYARLIIPANITLQLSHTVPISMGHHVGAIVRRRCKGEIGRLKGDKVSHYAIPFTVGKDIFEPKGENQPLALTVSNLLPSWLGVGTQLVRIQRLKSGMKMQILSYRKTGTSV